MWITLVIFLSFTMLIKHISFVDIVVSCNFYNYFHCIMILFILITIWYNITCYFIFYYEFFGLNDIKLSFALLAALVLCIVIEDKDINNSSKRMQFNKIQ